MTVFKFIIPKNNEEFTVMGPQDFTPISFAAQGLELVFWAVVDESQPPHVPYRFICVYTGVKFDDDFDKHIGTVTDSYGLVYHLFGEVKS